ncbi:MAG: hypothetical protein LH647_21600, partial [Leptolyngbyaceae cyanobacterium CAN_BIN12]|nr:hypothetical protein [Leptolyngbyaceae cyanobacterium CAN_BIN12]
MNQINSVESSGKFYERYSNCSEAQKLQIMQAATVQSLELENATPLTLHPFTSQLAEHFVPREQDLVCDSTNASPMLS